MRHSIAAVLPALLLVVASAPAAASPSRDACAGRFVDSLPAVISTSGTWCVRKSLSTAIASGSAIRIDADNVTLDCNGHVLSGLAAGRGSQAVGIEVLREASPTVRDVVVRRCHLRGFGEGIVALADALVEDNRLEGIINGGIFVVGTGIVRRNAIVDTGGADVAFAGGIGVRGTVDVLDNTVDIVSAGSSVDGLSRVHGIRVLAHARNATIRGNRVRGIDGIGERHGIKIEPEMTNENVLVAGNQVSMLAGGTGIDCVDSLAGLARGNLVQGATTAMNACADLGGNEVLP